jgi:hypothetical protein
MAKRPLPTLNSGFRHEELSHADVRAAAFAGDCEELSIVASVYMIALILGLSEQQ